MRPIFNSEAKSDKLMNAPNAELLKRSGWISIITNIALFGLKYAAGMITGSVALTADAWHTLSDSVSSIMVMFGHRTSRKPADGEHPFGHGRADLIVGVAIGAILGWIGVSFVIESVERLTATVPIAYGTIGLVATIASLLGKELLAQYAFYAARKCGSHALRADGWHHRSDALSSLAILFGILFAGAYPLTDAILGFVVAAFLFYGAWRTVWNCSRPLLGESPSNQSVDDVRDIASSTSSALNNVHHIHIHRYGDHTELTCHVRIDGDMSVSDAHDVVDRFEQALRDRMGVEPTVHVDPVDAPANGECRRDAYRGDEEPETGE